MPEAVATVPVWISLAGVGLAALAAAASWASVRLNRRQWLLSQQRFLSIQLLIERNGDRVLKILNGGPGSARGVRFCVATADEYVAGYAGEQFGGVLNTGERAEIVLDIQASRNDDQIKAIATCWDGVERAHIFTAHADHRIQRKSRRDRADETNPEAAFSGPIWRRLPQRSSPRPWSWSLERINLRPLQMREFDDGQSAPSKR
jgi:hypothetical protein